MNRKTVQGLIAGIALTLLVPSFLYAQRNAQTVVTVTPKAKRESTPKVQQEAVQISSSSGHAELTGWKWAGDSRLQLMILLDDSTSSGFGRQLGDLKDFILSLPPNTEVSVAYMQNGRAVPTQTFTFDHKAAANAVRVTQGIPGENASPYFVISDLAKKWPSSEPAARREVLMITDGVNPYSDSYFDPDDPYYQAAIHDAQKAGLIIYSIYYRGAGRFSHNPWVTDGGQNYLTGISHATGGHFYFEGLSNPVSLSPFLDDLSRRLQNQYELSFISSQNGKRETLANLKLKVQTPGVEVEAPEKAPLGQMITPGS